MELFGRHAETAALGRLLDRAADGAGSGLVLWGEPGIGKTALLDYAVGAASDAIVLRCRTNREIAAQLLISPRTVGHHLANVYPKLGITSRAELARIDFAGDLRLSPAGD